MNIGFRVNPNTAPRIELMDSRQPQIHSLKYQRFFGLLALPDEALKQINGAYPEILLERIRAEKYSNLPSRLSSAFLFEGLDEAKKFRISGWTESDGFISAYEIDELYSPVFFADMSITNMLASLRSKWAEFKDAKTVFIKPTLEESLEYICNAYWQGKTPVDLGLSGQDSIREVLVDGKVRLLAFVPLD